MSDLYDHALERNVLGIIANISALDVARARMELESSRLRKDSFHLEPHSFVFEASLELLKKGFPVDAFTVQSELKKNERLLSGDMEFITEVLCSQPHLLDSSLQAYSKTLNELSLRRNLFTILSDARTKSADRSVDPGVMLSLVSSQLNSVDLGVTKITTMSELMGGIAHHLDKVQGGHNEAIIPTGIGPLDHVIGGLQPTLIVIGALPGVGKSALVSTIARNVARNGKKIGIISLEDEASWLPWRILSRESSVEQFVLRFRKLSTFQHECTAEGYTAADAYAQNIVMADGSENPMTIDDVVQTARDMVVKHDCCAIVVDHVGEIEMESSGDRYDLEVSRHLSRLRSVSNTYKVPVVALMHLKRREGLTVGSKPTINDFANSSGSERKSRVALGLSRSEGGDTMQIHVLKNTMGKGVGMSVEVPFQGSSAMLESEEAKPYEVRRKRKELDSSSGENKPQEDDKRQVKTGDADRDSSEGNVRNMDGTVWKGSGIRAGGDDGLPNQNKLPWDD